MRSQEIHEHQEVSITHIVHISSVTFIFYKTSVYRDLKSSTAESIELSACFNRFLCLFSGCDFVPATKFSSKCQCCSQSSRNSTTETNGGGKHNSFFFNIVSKLCRTLRSKDGDIQILIMNTTFSQLRYLL